MLFAINVKTTIIELGTVNLLSFFQVNSAGLVQCKSARFFGLASGLKWPAITADEVDVCLARYVESVQFGTTVEPKQRHALVLQFVAGHPEQALLAYVQVETANWLRRVSPEDSDRFVMLAAANMVNCIGYLPGTEFDSLSPAAKDPQ